MTTVKYIPRFEHGSIAFRKWDESCLAYKVFGFRRSPAGEPEYRLFRDGLSFWCKSSYLLTGWEEDFNAKTVDWGDITPSYTPPEDFPSDEDKEHYDAEESEFIKLYSDLADDWKEGDEPIQLTLFPFFELLAIAEQLS